MNREKQLQHINITEMPPNESSIDDPVQFKKMSMTNGVENSKWYFV